MGPTWLLLAPDGPHVGPMNLAIRAGNKLEPTSTQIIRNTVREAADAEQMTVVL